MRKITRWFIESEQLSSTFPDRFWAKVQKTETCWLWTGGVSSSERGSISRGAKEAGEIGAHVASWIIHFGPVPEGLWVLHHCDVGLCVRPDHLWLGTTQDNTADRHQKGRTYYEIPNEVVAAIRLLWPQKTTRELAVMFNISKSQVWCIVRGHSR